MGKKKHPMQPIDYDGKTTETSPYGVIRFKENRIVCYLLEHGGLDLNKLAIEDFSKDDWTQFNQLIGYSVSGFGDLSRVSKKAVHKADKKAHKLWKKTHGKKDSSKTE